MRTAIVSDPVPNTDPSPISLSGVSPSGFDGNQRIVATVEFEDSEVSYKIPTSLPEYISRQRPEHPITPDLPDPLKLNRMKPTAERRFTFSQDTSLRDGKYHFKINNKEYKPDRTDTTVTLPSIEDWTLVNKTPVHHVFHIHQVDFIVTKVNGVRQPILGYQDSIDLPPCAIGIDSDTCQPGTESTTVVRIPFTNKIIADGGGEFVYHCHILFHEDNGMMQNIQVFKPVTKRSKA